ncbi:tetratricopeptide repeat protein [Nostoc sp. ChiQUE01b]|uniref:tetratricopeptide repeat protein n=1 Tax=Nostoc sp. ChiQUE01b TaxID=3075376 RepID=UPI002AD290C5|nr:tetratricopeptide repeat protein [Nostoc sp. ChiQUE01b]MDZ8260851.1 tetratricopeptide repeat protein [Nostoc sp. ChiQUE01b]
MNPNLSDWDDDLPPEPEEAYQDLLRALRRKSGFGLFFVQCTPVEADNLIVRLPQEIPQKKIAVLRLVEAIDNLYQPVAEFIKNKQVDILLIKGLEYSLYKYEKRNFGEITEGQFSNLTSVPHILNHLNQQRERFRDDFPISFVFLLRSFSINYFIHRAPDFFDWRSGVFELPTTPEVVEQESNRLLDEASCHNYLKLSHDKKIEKVLEIQYLISEKDQTEIYRGSLLFELGNLLFAMNEYEAALISYEKVLKLKISNYSTWWYKKAETLRKLGRYEEAITNYDEVIVVNPDDYWAWYHRGLSFSELGRYEEAINSYDQAIKIHNKDIEIWGIRGMAFYYLGIYEQAIASYDKAIEIKPECCAGLYYYKACCFAKQDIIKLAIENLQRAIAISY